MKPGDFIISKPNSYVRPVTGLYLGFRSTKFDKQLEYRFYKILTTNGIDEICIRAGEEDEVFEVIL